MIKGTERKIIFLKSTKSKKFDEAYFVIKDDLINDDETEILREAEKILFSAESCKKRKRKSSFSFKGLFLFFLGLSLGATVSLIISLFVF